MEFKDYYATLGVPRGADAKSIKSAYRKLARTHHPDVNPGDQASEDRFKSIAEAYEVLGDPEKRARYDELGTAYRRHQRSGGGGFDWNEWSGQPTGATSHRTLTPEELEGLFGGGGGFSDFFETLFGGIGEAQSPGKRAQIRTKGRSVQHPVRITLDEAFHGARRLLSIDGRRIEASIPPGVRDGSKVRIRGQGEQGRGGGDAGDLILVVEVAPHSRFARRGDDLREEVSVPLYTAMLGGEIDVPTFSGPVHLTIPAETANGRHIRLKGKGMPRLQDSGKRGDLIATVNVDLPTDLSADERRLFEELRGMRASEGDRSLPTGA